MSVASAGCVVEYFAAAVAVGAVGIAADAAAEALEPDLFATGALEFVVVFVVVEPEPERLELAQAEAADTLEFAGAIAAAVVAVVVGVRAAVVLVR